MAHELATANKQFRDAVMAVADAFRAAKTLNARQEGKIALVTSCLAKGARNDQTLDALYKMKAAFGPPGFYGEEGPMHDTLAFFFRTWNEWADVAYGMAAKR